MRWLVFVRPGDWLTALVAAAFCALSFPLAWQAGTPEKALIKVGGKVFAELDLSRNRKMDVPGALGTTRIVIDQRRVRVAADPGPRQYCVRQGWLARAGEIAICAPNQVSVQVVGGKEAYDSISY